MSSARVNRAATDEAMKRSRELRDEAEEQLRQVQLRSLGEGGSGGVDAEQLEADGESVLQDPTGQLLVVDLVPHR